MENIPLTIKIPRQLKIDLKRVADYIGIPVSTYAKLILRQAIKGESLTINGMTIKEERRLLKIGKEAEIEYLQKKTIVADSPEEALKKLGGKKNL